AQWTFLFSISQVATTGDLPRDAASFMPDRTPGVKEAASEKPNPCGNSPARGDAGQAGLAGSGCDCVILRKKEGKEPGTNKKYLPQRVAKVTAGGRNARLGMVQSPSLSRLAPSSERTSGGLAVTAVAKTVSTTHQGARRQRLCANG